MSRQLAMNTTVDGDTYAAGTVPPPEVAAKITNPKAWGDDSAPAAPAEPDPADEPADEPGRPLDAWSEDEVLAYATEHELECPEDADDETLRAIVAEHLDGADD